MLPMARLTQSAVTSTAGSGTDFSSTAAAQSFLASALLINAFDLPLTSARSAAPAEDGGGMGSGHVGPGAAAL